MAAAMPTPSLCGSTRTTRAWHCTCIGDSGSVAPNTSIASEVASSLAGTMLAAHRTGIAMGEVNGMREIVTAYVDSGLLERAQMDRYAIINKKITGCNACRAS